MIGQDGVLHNPESVLYEVDGKLRARFPHSWVCTQNFLLYPPWLRADLPPLEDVLQGKEGVPPFLEHVDCHNRTEVKATPAEVHMFIDQLENLKKRALLLLQGELEHEKSSSRVEENLSALDISK